MRKALLSGLQILACAFLSLAVIAGCGEARQLERTLEEFALQAVGSLELQSELVPPGGIPHDFEATRRALYFADAKKNRVLKFSRDGAFIGIVGERGGSKHYIRPTELTVDSEENVYIYDGSTKKLVVYDGNGRYVGNLHRTTAPRTAQLAILPNGRWLSAAFVPDDTGARSLALLEGRDSLSKPRRLATLLTGGQVRLASVLSRFIGFQYVSQVDRLYVLLPWQYEIRVIDPHNGSIVGSFGVKPPGYERLEADLESHPRELAELATKGAYLNDMLALENALLVRFASSTTLVDSSHVHCLLYALDQKTMPKALATENKQLLHREVLISAIDDTVFAFAPADLSESIGAKPRVEMYRLVDTPSLGKLSTAPGPERQCACRSDDNLKSRANLDI